MRGRRGAKDSPLALSGYYLALEISRGFAAVEALTSDREWQAVAEFPDCGFRAWATRLAAVVDWSRYVTHPRGPKQRPPPKRSGKHRHHYSTYRLLHPD